MRLLSTRLRGTCQHTQPVAPALLASASRSSTRHYTTALLNQTTTALHFKPSSPSRPPLLGRYQITPLELFRINSGKNIVLRDYAVQRAQHGRRSYDLHLGPDGLVHPKTGPNFGGPNGASLRPLGPKLWELLGRYRVKDTIIYRLPKGLELPKELVLLHEHSDQYSIQTTETISLNDLNGCITDWVTTHGEEMTKPEWCDRYPGPFKRILL